MLTKNRQPLLVFRYIPKKRLKRMIAGSVGAIALIATFGDFVSRTLDLSLLHALLSISLLPFIAMIAVYLFELYFFKEIMVYEGGMSKHWYLFGSKEIEYRKASFTGLDTIIAGGRVVHQKGSKAFWPDCSYLFSGIRYDHYLMKKNDIQRLNQLLSKLSGRDFDDFLQHSIYFDTFLKGDK